MGINAQTSVPSFSPGDTLTAANVNLLSNGVAVFSGTATRNAAFGSAGEKTLAEGQYAYLEDTNTTQYYDGAAWQAVGASGLVCVKAETAFSAATTVTADNVFTSTYTNYLINIIYTATSPGDVFLKLRASGTSASTNYNQSYIAWATSSSVAQSLAQTSFLLGDDGVATSSVQLTLFGPQLAAATAIQSNGVRNLATNDPRGQIVVGNHSTATAYDGIEILTANAMTGSYTIYGYSKTV